MDLNLKNQILHFYASAKRSVTGDILFLSCSSVRACVCPKTLIHFHQTYMYYRTEMNVSQFGVKGQVHGGIKYAGNSTFWAC